MDKIKHIGVNLFYDFLQHYVYVQIKFTLENCYLNQRISYIIRRCNETSSFL